MCGRHDRGPPGHHRSRQRPVRGRDVLDRGPARPQGPRPRRGRAGDPRRSHGPQGRHREGLRGDMAERCRVHGIRNALAQTGASTPSSRPRSGRRSINPTGHMPAKPGPNWPIGCTRSAGFERISSLADQPKFKRAPDLRKVSRASHRVDIRRDRYLTTPQEAGYFYQAC